MGFLDCRASAGFLTRYKRELREPLVWRQGSQVPMRWLGKRHLFLGRKFMTNLDSILKSRDITLPTKVHLAKAMVFPVVMYGCATAVHP